MSRPLGRRVIGVGLKMYLDHHDTLRWAHRLGGAVEGHPALADGSTTLVVLPTFPSLVEARTLIADKAVSIGAQNVAADDRGAFTGEVSGVELRQIGCEFVEIGHAERRRHFGEGDELLARKCGAAWRNGLVPIVCVGEQVRVGPDAAADECVRQLRAITGGGSSGKKLVVAYEPVWAIGASRPASNDHIRHVCAALRTSVDADAARVIYGGSARPGMLGELGGAVDGLFLGRSAHDVRAVAAVLDECLSQ
ncbi:triose-phosphate isomerase family protein [Microbacterium sp. SSW1-59]|uniref:triose-phosphate isomerase family protein n=1 Tax=Microbacterium xanthum TaxID=3079794 RepID=UPI002AD26F38|nr:triose-phosphate isomerase family protein [Microbacterium sp. SSW1-59]MDZ8201323.1 triose-phosphate isomerase family protein [Microbacterium sp. SSW1-59]